MIHRVVKVPMSKQAKPQLVARTNAPIVRTRARERVGRECEGRRGRGETRDFVREEIDVAVVTFSVDRVRRELVSEAEDREPEKGGGTGKTD
jgi:hypothetical protein